MSSVVSASIAFDVAAEAYDQMQNPVLALEERFLAGLLPDVRGLNVLDVGCGTGRWLCRFRNADARTVTGVDPSLKMLEIARKRQPGNVNLRQARADSLPVADGSADLVVMSFALSYCEDLDGVVRELARVTGREGSIFLTDLHPATEQRLGWKRTFDLRQGSVTVDHTRHGLPEVIEAFERCGFRLACRLEPSFGAQERPLFVANGKQEYFDALAEVPAIYIAQFVRTRASVDVSLVGGRVAVAGNAATAAQINIGDTRIASIVAEGTSPTISQATIDVSGCLVLPGLINAHDHLEFALYPRLGDGPYQSCRQWAEDIQSRHKSLIQMHGRVSKRARLYWGALRNLLSGVTTVCHHNPVDKVFHEPDFPVHVVEDFAWAHSLSFDHKVQKAYANSDSDGPFVVHAAEGIDWSSASEIAELERLGVLSDRTVLVHALGASANDVALINGRKSSVVVCPSSNRFLFGRTLNGVLVAGIGRVALGTDSPLTAAGELLDEMRSAREAFHLPDQKVYEMCTQRAATVLRLKNGEGSLRVGAAADLLIVRDAEVDPSNRLLELHLEDIELVVVGGRVHLASASGLRRVPPDLVQGLFPIRIEDRIVLWVRAPLPEMFSAAREVLGNDLLLGGKQVSYVG